MKTTLTRGLEKTVQFDISREQTIDFMGEEARVYATPMLVRDIEIACRDLLLEHLDAGEDSVGTRVAIDHIAATLLGMPVSLTVRIQSVEGRAVVFDIEGRDGVEPIVRGQHSVLVTADTRSTQRIVTRPQKSRTA